MTKWELDNLRDLICEMEYSILEQLNFDCDLELPNAYIAEFCEGADQICPDLEKFAYIFLNDSFQTECFLYFHPKVIAAACVWMSHTFLSKMKRIADPLSNTWLNDAGLSFQVVNECKYEIKSFYEHSKEAKKYLTKVECTTATSSSSSRLYTQLSATQESSYTYSAETLPAESAQFLDEAPLCKTKLY